MAEIPAPSETVTDTKRDIKHVLKNLAQYLACSSCLTNHEGKILTKRSPETAALVSSVASTSWRTWNSPNTEVLSLGYLIFFYQNY